MKSSKISSTSNSLLGKYLRLVEISRDLASTLDFNELLQTIVNCAVDFTGSTAASILLFDEVNNELYLQVTSNADSPTMQPLALPLKGSIAGEIIHRRKSLIVMDVKEHPNYLNQLEKELQFKTTSLLGVPLITKDKVLGVLEVVNKIHADFDQEDEILLGAFGSQAAVAIENSRLFHQFDLVSEIVHELRTPLASIHTAAHLLMRPETSQDQRISMAEIIQCETRRLTELASSFLDLSRLESGRSTFNLELVDIKELLKEVIAIMEGQIKQEGLALNIDLEELIPAIQGDPNKLKQVAINLISNAIKYNRKNGSITIGASGDGDKVVFYVQDAGIGMLPEQIPQLFNKFYRSPGCENMAQGTGLGLSIVKKIIDGHHGQIIVDTELGKGTTFKVILPTEQHT